MMFILCLASLLLVVGVAFIYGLHIGSKATIENAKNQINGSQLIVIDNDFYVVSKVIVKDSELVKDQPLRK